MRWPPIEMGADVVKATRLRTCHYRIFNVGCATPWQITAYGKAQEWMNAAIALVKPGVGRIRSPELPPRRR